MAKSKGIIKFRGDLGDMVGVNSKEGFYYRAKAVIPLSRYRTAPSYESLRINGAQFGQASKIRQKFVSAMGIFPRGATNTRMYSRLNAVMQRIIKCDNVSAKGKFTIVNGIATPEGRSQLSGFEFNRDCELYTALRCIPQSDIPAGTLLLKDFTPVIMAVPPSGATHVKIRAGLLRYNFANDQSAMVLSHEETFEVIDETVADLLFNMAQPEGVDGTLVLLLRVLYFQEVNGELYSMNGETSGAMRVVEVF